MSRKTRQAKKPTVSRKNEGVRIRLIEAIARGENRTEAAKLAGCSRRQIDRILLEPEVNQAIHERRTAILTEAACKLSGSAVAAAEALKGLLSSASEKVKLSAAKGILETCCRFHELMVFDARLEKIEQALELRAKRGPVADDPSDMDEMDGH